MVVADAFYLHPSTSHVFLKRELEDKPILLVTVTTHDSVQYAGRVCIDEFAVMSDQEMTAYLSTLMPKLQFHRDTLKLTCARSIGIAAWECTLKLYLTEEEVRKALDKAEEELAALKAEDPDVLRITYEKGAYASNPSNFQQAVNQGEPEPLPKEYTKLTTLQELIDALSELHGKQVHVFMILSEGGQNHPCTILAKFNAGRQILLNPRSTAGYLDHPLKQPDFHGIPWFDPPGYPRFSVVSANLSCTRYIPAVFSGNRGVHGSKAIAFRIEY